MGEKNHFDVEEIDTKYCTRSSYNVELMYMKFQKLLMTGCRDMDKKHQNGVFPPFVASQDFFQNRTLSLLYPYGALTSCKKLEKTNELSLRYLKMDERTDHGRTDKGDYYGPPRENAGSKMCKYFLSLLLSFVVLLWCNFIFLCWVLRWMNLEYCKLY